MSEAGGIDEAPGALKGARKGKGRREGAGLMASGAGVLGIKLANAAIGFATVTVFARLMPPETYGLYLLVLTVAQFLALPLQMGIPILLTREISIARAEGNTAVIKGIRGWTRKIVAIGTLVLGSLVIGLYAIVVAAGWPVLQEASWPLVLLCVALIPVIAEMKRVMGVLNGYRKPAQSRMPDGLVRPGLILLVGGFGLWMGWLAEPGLLAVYLGATLCAALFGWALIGRAERGHPLPDGPGEVRRAQWWGSLGPLTVVIAASTINTYADVLMLGALHSTESVAFYRVAAQIASAAMLVQVAVNAVLGPRMAALYATGETDRMQGLAVWGSRIAFGCTLAFAAVLAGVGETGFTWVLGAEYAPVYELAVFLAFGFAGGAFFGGTTMLLNMTRREKSNARYALWTAGGNILLNLALIPPFGPLGAAIATVITTLALQLLAWRRMLRDMGLRSDAIAQVRA